MGGGEPVESGGDASRQMHGHDALDEWFERNSTYVGEGSEDGSDFETQVSCKPVECRPHFMNFENLGLDSAVMHQGIQTVDLGGDKKSTSDHNQGIDNSLDIKHMSEHRPMDIDSDGSKVSSREHSVRTPGRQGVKQEAVVPAASNPLYSLMQIKLDKQDLSLVEKVTLLQGDIYELCNRVVPTSVVHNLGQDKYQLNFSQLNNSSLRIVGFYGNKNVMMDIFRTNHIVDPSTLRLMEKGELLPGLYSSLRHKTLHLFYWHQGSSTMTPASRKDISCNFIRYLAELCDSVHICLDSPGLGKLLTDSKSTLVKKKRTQRLKISVVKASENDLKFLPGWEKQLPLQRKDLGRPVNGSAAQSGLTADHVDIIDVQFTEGNYRSAVLVATTRPPKMSLKTESKIVKIHDVPELVRNWQTTYHLDAQELDNEEFVLLLEYGQLEGYKGLCDLKRSWKKKQAEQSEKVYKIDALVNTEELQVLEIFNRGVSAYLRLHFPWEEDLLSEGSAKMKCSLPDKVQLQKQGRIDHNADLDLLPTLILNVSEDEDKDIKATRDADVSEQLESEICQFWTGAQGSDSTEGIRKELIFCGSEISLHEARDKPKKTYTVQVSEQDRGGFKRFGPILYGEKYILKRTGASEKSIPAAVVFSATDKVCCVGPVLTGQPLSVRIGGGAAKHSDTVCGGTLKVLKRPCEDPVDMWMQAILGDKAPSLRQKASLVHLGFQQFRSMMGENDISNHQRIALTKAFISGNFEAFRSSTNLDICFVESLSRAWMNLLEAPPVQISALSTISPAVKSECVESHKHTRSEFSMKVSAMVKKNVFPLLKEKIKMDLKLEEEKLAAQARLEESKSVLSIRQVFNTCKTDLPTLSIKSCKYKSQYILFKETLTITYSTQVKEKENVTWKAIELAPLKKDLDALHPNANQVLIPTVHPEVRLMDLDSKESRLSKVVYLRSGSVLVFLEKYVGDPLLSIYLAPKLGADLSVANPKAILRKRVDLVAFDEVTRFLAFYVKGTNSSSIQIFFFDDTYSHMEFTGIEMNLREYTGSTNIVWMKFVPGKPELVLIDSGPGCSKCARLLELTQIPMFRARQINIPFPFIKGCISADGSCLIVLHIEGPEPEHNVYNITDEGSAQDIDISPTVGLWTVDSFMKSADAPELEEKEPRDDERRMLTFEVYWLDTMTHLKSHGASTMSVSDVDTLEATVVTFGTQMHLLIHDSVNPSVLYSTVLESSSASEVCEMQVHGSNVELLTPNVLNSYDRPSSDQKSCPELDFVYHIFDKYSTSPPLITTEGHLSNQKQRDVEFTILLKGLHVSQSDLGVKCEMYVKKGLEKLRAEKAKDFSGLAITLRTQALETWLESSSDENQGKLVPMGRWIQLLMCLVPIQIARAENNGLKPLVDGLQIPSNLSYADALSLAGMIRFGFYESMLESWAGEIKVVSSMGKQSSGKSYLLNHLSGSLLDVAGGRCTDGVWMTMRPTRECLYVLLDFEGLGSFERSEQEDMLLSIFNAAVSNITIFNKKDFHFDKETEAVFEKFQSGVSLVKADPKLFQGLFYIAIKDVDTSDVEDLKMEFQEKILQICKKSKQNFLTSMYGGEVEIAAMPPFQRPEYHDSIKEIAATVQELGSSHQNGLSFMRDLKLVLAQISTKDWSPIDSKRVAFKISVLRKHWATAISMGCLAADDNESVAGLINFDTGEVISESTPLQVGGHNILNLQDTGVQLVPPENQTIEMVLDPLRTIFQNEFPRDGENDEGWHSSFESFLVALADRRKERVLEWMRVNTSDFEQDGDVQKLRLEAVAMLSSLQQRLSLCSCKCPRCSLRCIQERSHPGDHSCRSDHKCTQRCTYCADDILKSPDSANAGHLASKCSDSAGHQGPHDCQEKAHTCGLDCSYWGSASNCNRVCTEKVKHTGDHRCNSRQHMCQSICSLPRCNNPCVIPFELGEHDFHACHEKMCPEKCTVQGCQRNCASKDHFHSEVPGLSHHFCGDEHSCQEKCEAHGICEILTEVVKKTRTFQGNRGTFEYEHVSEQNGIRKTCCIAIPPNQESHQGPHSHTTNNSVVHFCETRCHACGYFCNLPIGHTGFHSTNHGNMKDVNFVSETEEIDIVDRKYTWGESGHAEMCMMHCKNQGRGHIHLIPCLTHQGGPCAAMVIEGAKHETCKYGPDVDIPKDELTHAAFWKHLRFKDPCSEEDGRLFALCNHRCRSSEHSVATGSAIATTSSQKASYCVEPLWHAAVSKVGGQAGHGAGFITDDGHRFSCDHSKDVENHVIFVIDRSGSMDSGDCVPTMAKFTRNRLGCVYESILRFIRVRLARIIQDHVSVVLFDNIQLKAIDSEPIAETLVDRLVPHFARGGTTYSCGLRAAEEILARSATNPMMQKKIPVVIFLSDGGNNGGENPIHLVTRMKQMEPKLIFHTIKFGSDPYNQILMDMASAGSGTFQVSLDEVQLARSFEGLARSLKDKVSSLM